MPTARLWIMQINFLFFRTALLVACERRRISGGRFSPPKSQLFGGEKRPPEIRLRSQATLLAI